MTEGGIASWKKKEGESFTAGDVLLEIETDKATMDVEAQDDGVVGKIIVGDGSKAVPVGKLIALLAEDGDDISNLEIPAEDSAAVPNAESTSAESSPPPKTEAAIPQPTHTQSASPGHAFHPHSKLPLFPSVMNLLQDHNLSEDVDSLRIKGTGIRGMLTKGDVLAYLGLAQSPTGTYKPQKEEKPVAEGAKKAEPPKPLTGEEVRRLIIAGMQRSVKPQPIPAPGVTFDSIVADYIKPIKQSKVPLPPPVPKAASSSDYFKGLI